MKTFKETWECNECEHIKNDSNDGLPAPCTVSITFRDEDCRTRRFRNLKICLCKERTNPEWNLTELITTKED